MVPALGPAEDITAWEPERVFPTNTPGTHGYTYPNPLQLSGEGNRIYLFWRGGNFNPSFSTSSNGTSWSAARTLILNSGERPTSSTPATAATPSPWPSPRPTRARAAPTSTT